MFITMPVCNEGYRVVIQAAGKGTVKGAPELVGRREGKEKVEALATFGAHDEELVLRTGHHVANVLRCGALQEPT